MHRQSLPQGTKSHCGAIRVAVEVLPELAAVTKQAENVCAATHVRFDDYLKLFDESVRAKIRGAALGDGVTHVVCLENLNAWSSQFGHRVSMIVGAKQSCTLNRVLKTPYFRLGGKPSQFCYPVAYAAAPAAQQTQEAGNALPD